MDESRIEQILRQPRPDEPVYQPVPLDHAIAAPPVERVRRVTVAVPQAGWQPAWRLGAMAGLVAVVAVLAVLAVGMPSANVGPARTTSPAAAATSTPNFGCVYVQDAGRQGGPTQYQLADETGLIATCEVSPVTEGLLADAFSTILLSNPANDPRVLRAEWWDGACGGRTISFTRSGAGFDLVIRAQPFDEPYECPAIALPRGATFVLRESVRAASVRGFYRQPGQAMPSPQPVPTGSTPPASLTPPALRTFAVDRARACQGFDLAFPVTGTLTGSEEDPREPVWLTMEGGRRASVVWPEGFTVAFEPGVVLLDEAGAARASAGDVIELSQVWEDQAAGWFDQPYHAAGLLFGRCYPRAGADPVPIGPATWRVDGGAPEPSAESRTLELRGLERACAGGQEAADRVLEPVVDYGTEAITVTLSMAGVADAECSGPNPEFSMVVDLREPIGGRRLVDGGEDPPAERWPSSSFPVVAVADLSRSVDQRIQELVGPEGCVSAYEIGMGAPWDVERIEREAARLPGGIGRVLPRGAVYVGDPVDAAVAFGAVEAFSDGTYWAIVVPYAEQDWLTGFVRGEWEAAPRWVGVWMAEIDLSEGRSAWAAGYYGGWVGACDEN